MSTSKLMKPTCTLARHGERLLMLLLCVCCTDAVDECGGLHTCPYKLAACFREPGPEPHIFDPTSVGCGEELSFKGICQCRGFLTMLIRPWWRTPDWGVASLAASVFVGQPGMP